MTRYLFPQDRLVFRYGAPGTPLYSPQGETITVFTDEAGLIPAGIQTPDGEAQDNTLTIGPDCLIPEFLGPNNATTLYAKNRVGAISPLYAQTGQFLTGEGGGGGGAVSSVNGQTGTVILDSGDVGAYPETDGLSLAARVTATESGRLLASNNLSELDSPGTARTNLGLGGSATRSVGTASGTVAAGDDARIAGALQKASNLSDLASPVAARAALGLTVMAVGTFGSSSGTVMEGNDSRVSGAAQKSANLSDLASANTARTNLGLGGAATLSVGTSSGTVAAGDDSRISGAVQKSANLSDLANAATARTNLGLGGAALLSVGTIAGSVAAGNDSRFTGALQKSSNLSDLGSVNIARTNLGLGGAAVLSVGTGAGDVAAGNAPTTAASSAVSNHVAAVDPHGDRAFALTKISEISFPVSSVNGETGAVDLTAAEVGGLTAASNLSDLTNAGTARTNLGLTAVASAGFGTAAGTVAQGNDSRITGAAQKSQNLSDLTNAATARTNLGLTEVASAAFGTGASDVVRGNDSRVTGALQAASNLSDLASASTARTSLGLGTAATRGVGTSSGTVAAGDDSRFGAALQKSENLADLVNPSTARDNLGLGNSSIRNVGTSGTDVAAGNAPKNEVDAHEAETDPHGDRAYADGKFRVRTVRSIATHIAANPFYVAHRGSGGEFPEHTMSSYENAVAYGAQAIEVSCHASADGVLFCMHDTTLDRVTGGTWTGSHSTWTWAALKNAVKVKGQGLLGSGWEDQPIATVREVLDRFVGRVVIFLEAKGNSAVVPLQQMLLNNYPGCQESVVWKNYYIATSWPWAKANGFYTWGYIDSTTTAAQMDAVDANVDMWGIPVDAADAKITEVVNRPGGKPVMSWDVHRRSEVTRLTNLGVRGMMCAQYLYLTRSTAIQTVNDWAVKIKAPGTIGGSKYDPNYALKFEAPSSAYNPALSGNSVLMGSFSPIVPGATGYKITFDMMFPTLPSSTLHGGVAFGRLTDEKYSFGAANSAGGYHMLIRASGDMQLYTHTAGVTSGTQLATTSTTAPTAGGWMSFEIEVNTTQVILRRTDSTGWTQTTANTAYRGAYFLLHNGSLTDSNTIPRFRNLQVVTL